MYKVNTIDSTKTWYNENKDEISESTKEVWQSDKNIIRNVYNDAAAWYAENKEELREAGQRVYESDKETAIYICDTIKNIEY